MTVKDQNLLTEIFLTFALLFLATALFGESSPGAYRTFFLFSLAGGFYLGWLIRDQGLVIKKYALTIGTLGVFAWLIQSVFHSSFLYKDVVLICVQGIVFMELIFSLDKRLLTYMQYLCIPLYICLPFFVDKDQGTLIAVTMLANNIVWFVLLRVKLYSFLEAPVSRIVLTRNFGMISLAFLLCLNLVLGWSLSRRFPLAKMTKGGVFDFEGTDLEGSSTQLENEYYGSQDKLLKKMGDLINDTGSLEEKHEMITFLDTLIKDTLNVREVEKAALGLISRLKTEGLGLENGREEAIVILKDYVEKKAQYQMKKTQDLMRKSRGKNERLELARQVQEWQSLGQASLEPLSTEEERATEPEVVAKEALLLNPSRGSSLTKEPLPEARPAQEIGRANSGFNLDRQKLKKGVLAAALSMLIIFLIGFITLYCLIEAQKKKIMSFYRSPREFIIALYGNIKGVLDIFGLPCSVATPPLQYAERIENQYPAGNNLFSRFCAKFEEAKYSSHVLPPEDSARALEDYNGILKNLSGHYHKRVLALKYCLALIKRRAFYI
mgnify:CR=1 FL=1